MRYGNFVRYNVKMYQKEIIFKVNLKNVVNSPSDLLFIPFLSL